MITGPSSDWLFCDRISPTSWLHSEIPSTRLLLEMEIVATEQLFEGTSVNWELAPISRTTDQFIKLVTTPPHPPRARTLESYRS